jgi:hypothetical protein
VPACGAVSTRAPSGCVPSSCNRTGNVKHGSRPSLCDDTLRLGSVRGARSGRRSERVEEDQCPVSHLDRKDQQDTP